MAKFEYISWLLDWLDSLNRFEFQWDSGNSSKNKDKHDVSMDEVEQIFKNRNYVPLGHQTSPKPNEPRFGLLGMTNDGRLLSVCFTIRDEKIRVISARPMSVKERMFYARVC